MGVRRLPLSRIAPGIRRCCQSVRKIHEIQLVAAVCIAGFQMSPRVFLWIRRRVCLCITLQGWDCTFIGIDLHAEKQLIADIFILFVANCSNMSSIV